MIRGVLIQSCLTGAKNFTNYVFCHPQFSGVIQNIENCCAIRAKIWKFNFWLYKIDYFDINQQTYNILDNTTELWMTKCIIGEIFSSGGATLYKYLFDQTVSREIIRLLKRQAFKKWNFWACKLKCIFRPKVFKTSNFPGKFFKKKTLNYIGTQKVYNYIHIVVVVIGV